MIHRYLICKKHHEKFHDDNIEIETGKLNY